jgi:hypothetical protein
MVPAVRRGGERIHRQREDELDEAADSAWAAADQRVPDAAVKVLASQAFREEDVGERKGRDRPG